MTLDFKALGSNLRETNIFTKKMKRCSQDLNTGPLDPKSAIVTPTPSIDENWLEMENKTEDPSVQAAALDCKC